MEINYLISMNSDFIVKLSNEIVINHNISNISVFDSQILSHCERVSKYMHEFSVFLKLDENKRQTLVDLGRYHDIGKYTVPESILTKPGKLTKEEYDIMKKHSLHGSSLIMSVKDLEYLSIFIKHHHESWDGNGYPEQLKKLEIPYECRILAIVDAFDAMTSHRCYRHKLSIEESLRELIINKEIQFDPNLVISFIQFAKEKLL